MKAVIRPMTPRRVFAARAIAIAADFLQIAVFPVFSEGVVSPLDTGLDLAVAGALTALVGWHWAFLPSFAAEMVPFLDLVPTWTAAVFIATRPSRSAAGKPPALSSGSARESGAAEPGGEGESRARRRG